MALAWHDEMAIDVDALCAPSLSAASSLSAFSGSNTACVEPPPKSSTAYGAASAGESADRVEEVVDRDS